jgi:hypothetical protein
MKSLGALKDLTSKLKQQIKPPSSAPAESSWVKKGDIEKERQMKYLEEQAKIEEEKRKKQEEKLREIQEHYEH